MKTLITGFILIFSTASFSSEVDKLKICLSLKYQAQNSFFKKNSQYTSKNSELKIPSERAHYCEGFDFEIEASKSKFKLTAMIQGKAFGYTNHKKVIHILE